MTLQYPNLRPETLLSVESLENDFVQAKIPVSDQQDGSRVSVHLFLYQFEVPCTIVALALRRSLIVHLSLFSVGMVPFLGYYCYSPFPSI